VYASLRFVNTHKKRFITPFVARAWCVYFTS